MIDDETPQTDAADAANDEATTLDAGEAVAQLVAENAALKEQALRYAAEAENTKRRAERESNDARAYAIQRFARDLFEVADNLSRALQAAPREHPDANVKNLVLGIDMTEKALKIQEKLKGKAVEQVSPEEFDDIAASVGLQRHDPKAK